ncbi:hypothetical protein EVAR_9460_1 [Eumeta japonica]|uniref:Uncharacterized protein n=1 Tax=Eumeta variegata TaxID=151549 RepID=A0A4C1UEG3_EUMVA|nr:hypothetical protein EVAR_9460_1 [Eumeta japonica]
MRPLIMSLNAGTGVDGRLSEQKRRHLRGYIPKIYLMEGTPVRVGDGLGPRSSGMPRKPVTNIYMVVACWFLKRAVTHGGGGIVVVLTRQNTLDQGLGAHAPITI